MPNDPVSISLFVSIPLWIWIIAGTIQTVYDNNEINKRTYFVEVKTNTFIMNNKTNYIISTNYNTNYLFKDN